MISTVVLTRNEEKNILDCLKLLKKSDEIVIIDDYSTDKTIELIDKLNDKRIKVYRRKSEGDFSSQRNYGLSKATGEWVLFVDADERVSNNLWDELVNFSTLDISGAYIKRVDIFNGRELKHGEVGNMMLLRFGKKDSGKWNGVVHEVWDIKTTTQAKNPILHYSHDSISEFLTDINMYSSIRAEELYRKKVRSSLFQVIFYPKVKFIQNYFIRSGYKDGIEGFVYAMMMSFHSFLVRGKLWLLVNRKIKP